jgi:hypothetical protein
MGHCLLNLKHTEQPGLMNGTINMLLTDDQAQQMIDQFKYDLAILFPK